MTAHAAVTEERRIAALAREYERAGYKVLRPAPGEAALPPFLEGFRPDLIAERDDDRVVLEVKSASSLKGANELVSVAQRACEAAGWRFELVVIPDQEGVPDSEELEQLFERARAAVDADLPDIGYLYTTVLIDGLLQDLALEEGRRSAAWSAPKIAHFLATLGRLEPDEYRVINDAMKWRSRLVHAKMASQPTREDLDRLFGLAHNLRRRLHPQVKSRTSARGRAGDVTPQRKATSRSKA
jgi:hypothetical protein